MMRKSSKHFFIIVSVISLVANIVLLTLYFKSRIVANKVHNEVLVIEKTFNDQSHIGSDEELIKRVLDFGDTSAYDALSISFLDREPGAFLPYALYMANKHNYFPAFYEVFIEFEDLFNCSFNNNIEVMDSLSRRIALSYLLKAYDSYAGTDFEKGYLDLIHSFVRAGFIHEKQGTFTIPGGRIDKTKCIQKH